MEEQMRNSVRVLSAGDLAAFTRNYAATNEADDSLCRDMERGETVRVLSFWDDFDGQVWVRVTLTGKDEYTVTRNALRFVER